MKSMMFILAIAAVFSCNAMNAEQRRLNRENVSKKSEQAIKNMSKEEHKKFVEEDNMSHIERTSYLFLMRIGLSVKFENVKSITFCPSTMSYDIVFKDGTSKSYQHPRMKNNNK